MTTSEGIEEIIETKTNSNSLDDELKKKESLPNKIIVYVNNVLMQKRYEYDQAHDTISFPRKVGRTTIDFFYESLFIGDSTRLTQEKAAEKRGKPAWFFTLENRVGAVFVALFQYAGIGAAAGSIENNYTGAETVFETNSFHGFMTFGVIEASLAVATGILAVATKKAYPGITLKSALQNVPTYIKRGTHYAWEKLPESTQERVLEVTEPVRKVIRNTKKGAKHMLEKVPPMMDKAKENYGFVKEHYNFARERAVDLNLQTYVAAPVIFDYINSIN